MTATRRAVKAENEKNLSTQVAEVPFKDLSDGGLAIGGQLRFLADSWNFNLNYFMQTGALQSSEKVAGPV